jgi:putative ABC transport system substrate-binding protein
MWRRDICMASPHGSAVAAIGRTGDILGRNAAAARPVAQIERERNPGRLFPHCASLHAGYSRAMRRRDFIAGLGCAVALAPHAHAQPRRYRVGFLDTVSRQTNPYFTAFQKVLSGHGYMEGTNLSVEYRSPEGRNEGFPELAMELARLEVDVIVTRGTPAALAAKAASARLPVVMAAAGDPVGIARAAPASVNLTGFGANLPGAERQRVDILRELLPKLTRVAAMLNLSNPSRRAEWTEIEAAARALGISAQIQDLRAAPDIEPAFAAAAREHADALLVGSDTLVQTNQAIIVRLAAAQRLPAIYTFRDFVEVGGFMSYGVNLPDLYGRAADYVDKILKGAKPAELPIEPAARAELVLSDKAGKALGLAIAPALLARAEVIP